MSWMKYINLFFLVLLAYLFYLMVSLHIPYQLHQLEHTCLFVGETDSFLQSLLQLGGFAKWVALFGTQFFAFWGTITEPFLNFPTCEEELKVYISLGKRESAVLISDFSSSENVRLRTSCFEPLYLRAKRRASTIWPYDFPPPAAPPKSTSASAASMKRFCFFVTERSSLIVRIRHRHLPPI